MSPRWWRFFEELYRRTGALEDNINGVEIISGSSATTAAMTITGAAPTIINLTTLGTGSMAVAGQAVKVNPIPDTGSAALTGQAIDDVIVA
jgi:hypothetical protein